MLLIKNTLRLCKLQYLSSRKMSSNCIFCKIISHNQSADILYEDDETIIFNDIKPAAKNHVLVVPKTHIKSVNSLTSEDKTLVENLVVLCKKLFEEKGFNFADSVIGFHVPPFNSISHLHLHVISPASEMSFLSRWMFRPNSYWFATVDSVISKL